MYFIGALRNLFKQCYVVLFVMLYYKGETPGEGFPSCYFTNSNSPLPALRKHRGVSPSADGDQGLCPWTLVAFVKAPQNLSGPAGLDLRKR